MNEYLIFLPL